MFSAPGAADPTAAAGAGATAAPDVGAAATDAAGGVPSPTAAHRDAQMTIVTVPVKDLQDVDTSGTSGTTAAPLGRAGVVPPSEAYNPPPVTLVVVSTRLHRELMELHTLSFRNI